MESAAPVPPWAPSRPRLFVGSRPLKRWRYVGVFCEELMACAALVQIGPARQSFWALHRREGSGMRERTRLLPGDAEVKLGYGDPHLGGRGELHIHDRGVHLDLRLDEDADAWVEVSCPNGRSQVWTRKQAGVGAQGTLALDGEAPRVVEALAVIDDTCGYHARHTEWRWSAGVGSAPDGSVLAWNLVSGVNDPPSGSERAVWVAGRPSEAPPVQFAEDLSTISWEEGGELRFQAEAQRSRRENLLLVASDYRAPFGSFSGTFPGGVELAQGLGVMEHHRARW